MSTKTVQVKPLTLSSSIGTSNTTAIVSGMIGLDGVDLTQADFGTIIYGTFEPNTVREEAVSFTITSNTAGVANIDFTASGRGLIGKSPYGTGGITYTHAAGAKLVISNNPNLFNKFTAKDNDETVSGVWSFPTTPAGANNPVTKSHLESSAVLKTGNETVAGIKTFSSSPIVPDATTAQQPLTKAQSDVIEATNVKLTGTQTVAGVKTFSSSPIVPDATTAQQPISKAQFDAAGASFSATASDTVRGTTKIDVAADSPSDPKALTATANRVAAIAGGGDFGTPSGSNKFLTQEFFSARTIRYQYDLAGSPFTWTKQTGLRYVIVETWGAGGGGSGGSSAGRNAGGGGGGYNQKRIEASSLSATETVTVGTGGAVNTVGGNSTFGAHVTGYGGGGGGFYISSNVSGGGGGGVTGAGSNGNEGGVGAAGNPGNPIVGDGNFNAATQAAQGGSYGGGGGSNISNAGGNSLYGGGGGGQSANTAGGKSAYGGAGGTGGVNGTVGTVPGGGGAGGTTTAGIGAAGRIIVTEYYS